jgi:hypothetical protein
MSYFKLVLQPSEEEEAPREIRSQQTVRGLDFGQVALK